MSDQENTVSNFKLDWSPMSSLGSEEPVPPSPVFEDEDLQDVLMQMLAQEQYATAEENIDTNFLNMDESEGLNFVDQQQNKNTANKIIL
jgi:hypothetical protein